jgi:hypothetical protein
MKKFFLFFLIFCFNSNVFSQDSLVLGKFSDSIVMKFINNVIENTEFSEPKVFVKKRKSTKTKTGECNLTEYPVFVDCSSKVVLSKKDNSDLFVFQIFDKQHNKLISFNIIFSEEKILELQTIYFKGSLKNTIHWKKNEEFAYVISSSQDRSLQAGIPVNEIMDVIYFYMIEFIE